VSHRRAVSERCASPSNLKIEAVIQRSGYGSLPAARAAARPNPGRPPQTRLRASARAAIATSARSASFTDFESGKASANAGSRSTALVPLRYLSAYLPRTPPEKSYSALISGARRLEGGFFIAASFMLHRRACADRADTLSSHGMNHSRQTSLAGHSGNDEALFADGVIRVWDRDREGAVKDGARLRKSNAVLPPVRRIFPRFSAVMRSGWPATAGSLWSRRLSPLRIFRSGSLCR